MPAAPTPVTLVTGFLGAGKTTLLKHLLEGRHGRRLGVVVNDFGAIAIDAELIREVRGQAHTVRLTNGCICCTIRGDLLETVVQLGAQPEPPDAVIVEASGVSDPHQIAATFALAELAPITRLDSIIAVLDSDGYERVPPASRMLARRQIEAADLVLMNKRDLATAAQLSVLREEVRRLSPLARSFECDHCRVPWDLLLGPDGTASRAAHRQRAGPHDHTDHAAQYTSFAWESAVPLDAERLRDAIQAFPRSILRGKGFVQTVQAPEEEGEFHLVGGRASLARGRRWPGAPRTRLVFIAEHDAAAGASVRELLAAAQVHEVNL
ncbi:MAG: GTP-binding protein [Burkholderiales bacterium]|nr:GTP-binding protein [Burkholderiales bacterium]